MAGTHTYTLQTKPKNNTSPRILSFKISFNSEEIITFLTDKS